MELAKLISKGQITISIDIRRKKIGTCGSTPTEN